MKKFTIFLISFLSGLNVFGQDEIQIKLLASNDSTELMFCQAIVYEVGIEPQKLYADFDGVFKYKIKNKKELEGGFVYFGYICYFPELIPLKEALEITELTLLEDKICVTSGGETSSPIDQSKYLKIKKIKRRWNQWKKRATD